ncbi:MFS transporter [Amycolatopsis sp. SID8362]|nr:MFS transporter [Amycolatopsis sp. SID8362]NBH02280.1 MFS transporter [Amycolatopsis sp. SID8362]NED38983.1 aromatic acid/H+ symport family MFS transporter [Amycolatopsis sp. SID8362]
MTLEGYDLVAFGATTSLLLHHQPWHLSLSALGMLGSLTPVGMLIGALLVGQFTDRYGRRGTTLVSIVLVALGMFASGVAANPEIFGAGRFVVGLGVGAIFPALAPLVFELAPAKRKNLTSAIVLCGNTVGGSLAAVVANTVLAGNFRLEYLIGGIAAVVLVPVTLLWLPESPAYQGKTATPARDSGMRLVLRPPYLGTTILFCGMVICSFLLIFGMNTWLPQLMQAARYPLGSSLTFLMLLNLGATVGGLGMAVVADRVGSKGPVIASFLVAGLAIVALSVRTPQVILYATVLIGGAGVLGVQGLINVYLSRVYPVHARASAIGVALGVGRIGAIAGPTLGGWILAAGFAPRWNFVLFALPALLGALLAIANRAKSPLRNTQDRPGLPSAEPTR